MSTALKSRNSLGLYGLMAGNLGLFYGAVQHNAILSFDWADLLKRANEAIPAGLGIALTGILNAQLTPLAKARFVFLKWKDPLPGSEAFSKYGPSDSRVDMEALKANWGPLPTAPAKQNALWYRMYKTVESSSSVLHAHHSFLFARDYSCLGLLLLITLTPVAYFEIQSVATVILYAAILVLQVVLSSRAARTHGFRFVTNVLAACAASQPPRGEPT
jgi:hypothetical protein